MALLSLQQLVIIISFYSDYADHVDDHGHTDGGSGTDNQTISQKLCWELGTEIQFCFPAVHVSRELMLLFAPPYNLLSIKPSRFPYWRGYSVA